MSIVEGAVLFILNGKRLTVSIDEINRKVTLEKKTTKARG